MKVGRCVAVLVVVIAPWCVNGGRPRPVHSSALEMSRTMASLAEAITRLANQVNSGGLSDSIGHRVKRTHRTISSEPISDLELSVVPNSEEATGLQDTGAQSRRLSPPKPGFPAYQHYDEKGGYSSQKEDPRMEKNLALKAGSIRQVSAGPSTHPNDLAACDKHKDDTTVHDLRSCLGAAYGYFKNTLAKAWLHNEQEGVRDHEVLNLVFDRIYELANVKRSLDAFNADETKVSGVLLRNAQDLRNQINTIIERGVPSDHKGEAHHVAENEETKPEESTQDMDSTTSHTENATHESPDEPDELSAHAENEPEEN